MTLSHEVLSGLRERIKAATGPDRKIDCEIEAAIIHRERFVVVPPPFYDPERYFCNPDPSVDWIGYDLLNTAPRYTASIDAALALVERMLPGWKWGVSSIAVRTGEKTAEGYPRYGEGFRAHVTAVSALRPMPSIGEAPTAPLAILLALLTALQENTK